MKKCFTVILMLILFSFYNYASGGDKEVNENTLLSKNSLSLSDYNKSVNSFDTDYDLSLMNLQVDVMGLVFVGPQVTLDFQFANMIAVGPYFRWHYAGLMYQGTITDWFSNEVTTSLASCAFGVQAKFLMPVGTGQHRPYVELGYEKVIGSDSWDPGGTYGKRIYEYELNAFHFNVGYRLLSNSSFNLSVALGIAIAKETKNIGYYEFGDDPIDYYPLETRSFPILQLMLGWQLGR